MIEGTQGEREFGGQGVGVSAVRVTDRGRGTSVSCIFNCDLIFTTKSTG